jgi:N6-adenosine-specific RNA methylase IME4
MENKKFDIIVADPAWKYDGKTGVSKKVDEHYQVQHATTWNSLPVADIAADDSLLFMWCSGPVLKQAIELMGEWGWTYKQIAFIWDKERIIPSSYVNTQTEMVIVGKRGKIPQPRGCRKQRQMLQEPRGKHSAKPEVVQDRIDLMFPTQNKLELFARRHREGWTCEGNELDGLDIFDWVDKWSKDEIVDNDNHYQRVHCEQESVEESLDNSKGM